MNTGPMNSRSRSFSGRRNFYKVEEWSRDGQRIEGMLFAGNSLATAQRITMTQTRTMSDQRPARDTALLHDE